MLAPLPVPPCPRCSYPLRPLSNGRTELEHCDRCGGNYFSAGDMARSFGADTEPAAWVHSEITQDKGASKLKCPMGHGAMEAFDLGFGETHVEVDVCKQCGGLWLDPFEANQLVHILDADREERAAQDAKNARVSTYLFQLLTGLPVEVYHPVRRRPVVVLTLIAALILIYVGEVAAEANGRSELVQALTLIPAKFIAGEQLWGIVSHAFLHAGVAHLLGNLYFLYIFGDNVEDRLRPRGFALLYAAAGLAGGLLHLVIDPGSNIPMLGASGAISGLMGAYLALFPKVRVWVVLFFIRFQVRATVYIALWFGFQMLMAYAGAPGVAWYAHIGGFLAGLMAARLLSPAGWPKQAGERVAV